MSDDLRRRLLLTMWDTINCWSAADDFEVAAYAVASALLDGRISEQLIVEHPYPAHDASNGYQFDEDRCREICHLAGYPYTDDPDQRNEHGRLINLDSEEIGTAVDLLREITRGVVTIHGGGFSFYQDCLDQHDLTVEQVSAYMADLDLKGAARLFVDAYDVHKNGA